MVKPKHWTERVHDPRLQQDLIDRLQVSPVVARILMNRGVTSFQEARQFLDAGPSSLHDPYLLPDLEKAVRRIKAAMREDEKILVYGDYDVDGITATSLYIEFFKKVGKQVEYYIPNRLEEGYGLNTQAVQNIADRGVRLMITADCGTTSVDEIALAQKLGTDVIVADHHQPPEQIPPAFALINPHRRGSDYPFTGLCAVGIAFKLAQALLTPIGGKPGGLDLRLVSLLDLVALGTIADVAPLRDENRFFVKEGLRILSESPRLGIQELKQVAGLEKSPVGVGAVGFVIAPRINAGGRMAHANEGVTLLTTTDRGEARRAAQFLNQQNQDRQRIEAEILKEAHEMISNQMDLDRSKSLVLASAKWHPGVIGIIASRLVERYYRPAVVIALSPEGMGKGSARSIPSFHLYDGLAGCSDLLKAFGGHKYAAGLTIQEKKIGTFRDRFETVVRETLSPEDFLPRLMVDAELQLHDLNFNLTQELDRLSPYGASNPEPVFVTRALEPLYPRIVGKNHLKLRVRKGNVSCDAIGFQMGSVYSGLLSKENRVDLAFSINEDTWQGEKRLQLRIKDMKSGGGPLTAVV